MRHKFGVRSVQGSTMLFIDRRWFGAGNQTLLNFKRTWLSCGIQPSNKRELNILFWHHQYDMSQLMRRSASLRGVVPIASPITVVTITSSITYIRFQATDKCSYHYIKLVSSISNV